MYTAILCQKVDKRHCIFIASKDNESTKIGFKIPFWRNRKNIKKFVYFVKKEFHLRGFDPTGAQISSALSLEYPDDIPYVYY